MCTIRSIGKESTSIATGFKAAVLVVVIGIIAAVSDHALLTSGASAPVEASPARDTSRLVPASTEGFEVPDHLRANAGEVPAPIVGF